jgi:thiol:disulfide interchange protein
MRVIWRFLLACALLGGMGSASAASHTSVKLLLSAEIAKPGDTITAGLQLRMEPKWHTYWKNGGDSGAPTKIQWELPPGLTAGEIRWPAPEKTETGGLFTYGYENEVVLLIPLKIAANAAEGPVELRGKVNWLECSESCIPGKGEVTAKLTVGKESKLAGDNAVLAKWEEQIPKPDPSQNVTVTQGPGSEPDTKKLTIEWATTAATSADFFPYAADDLDISHSSEITPAAAGKIRIAKVLKKTDAGWGQRLAGIIVPKEKSVRPFEINLSLNSAAAASTTTSDNVAPAIGTDFNEKPTLWKILLFAFLGGLILNIMPCVLPVIALKIFGFVNQSREDPGRIRKMGLMYGVGVLISFLVLAGLVIGLKAAGKSANWGMQFQNPTFLVVMTVVVTLVALNLFGLFEITLHGKALGAAGELARKEGYPGAFFNGVLATALGTPCTAPFLSVALGFAFTQPAIMTVLVFLTVGLGLASPYVLLSFQPRWLKFLPKPGAWMEKFKIAMGFPMLATAVWMFTLATPRYGPSSAFWLGIFLVIIALSGWIWGEFVQRGSRRQGLAMGIVVLLLGWGYFGILEKEVHWREKRVITADTGVHREPGGIEWEKWSAEAVAKAQEARRAILVDFTADWCPVCQSNKRTSLEVASVRAKLKEINAVALLADYTDEDPLINEGLTKLGRAAVPLVVVYPANPQKKPILFDGFFTASQLLDALEAAKGAAGKITRK